MNSLLLFQRMPRYFRRHKLLRAFAFVGGGNVHRVRVNRSFEAYIDVRDGFARLVAIEEEFEAEFFSLAQRLLPRHKPVFFDVGANYGLMSFGLWNSAPDSLSTHLFEANPNLCAIIERSIQLNQPQRFHLVNRAVMDSAADVCLSFEVSHTGAGYVSKEAGGLVVKSITLDEYIRTKEIDRVDLLKIDVEGNEAAVLNGASDALKRKLIRAIYFEYCPAHLERSKAKTDPIEFLRINGYQIFAFDQAALAAAGKPTHQFVSTTAFMNVRIPLVEVQSPLKTRITDLLALPQGLARALSV